MTDTRTDTVELTTAISRYGHTSPLLDGDVSVPGATLRDAGVRPIIAAYRRMIRGLEFDVAELAPSTYLIAKEAGIPITAIPVFLMRRLHHTGIAVRDGAGIEKPKDLEGRTMGVRAYSVTSGVWSRGILTDDHDVDVDAVQWVVDDEDHVTTFVPPPNVRSVEPGQSLAELLRTGGIHAAFTGIAGIGRSGPPAGSWEAAKSEAPSYRELFPDAKALEEEWYRRTGVLPLHAVVVIRDEVIQDNPWLPATLYQAFEEAKVPYLASLAEADASDPDVAEHLRNQAVVGGGDPLPYGLEANEAAISTLIRYARDQHLITRTPELSTLFARV